MCGGYCSAWHTTSQIETSMLTPQRCYIFESTLVLLQPKQHEHISQVHPLAPVVNSQCWRGKQGCYAAAKRNQGHIKDLAFLFNLNLFIQLHRAIQKNLTMCT